MFFNNTVIKVSVRDKTDAIQSLAKRWIIQAMT